ncbi:MAG TPA: hypothetical protein VFI02_03665 [Armatimonadota bacterium]|nr:hypothetical protein [Armatimonadota bacterium]
MASEQAWIDFKMLRSIVEQAGAESSALKDLATKLEAIVAEIAADPDRLAEAGALADTHFEWTSAALLARHEKLLASRVYLISQGL